MDVELFEFVESLVVKYRRTPGRLLAELEKSNDAAVLMIYKNRIRGGWQLARTLLQKRGVKHPEPSALWSRWPRYDPAKESGR